VLEMETLFYAANRSDVDKRDRFVDEYVWSRNNHYRLCRRITISTDIANIMATLMITRIRESENMRCSEEGLMIIGCV
jgi:hypothetical protein